MKGLTIGICDDERLIGKQLSGMLTSIMEEAGGNAHKILYFESGEQLFGAVTFPDILFLDIEMPGQDGIAIGKEVCRRYPECRIIMATGRDDRMKEAFHIRALRFVTKPFETGEIREALQTALSSFIGYECISLYYQREEVQVHQRDIRLFRAFNGYVEAYAGGRCLRRDCSLSTIEEMLDVRLFCRIDRSYIVNLQDVTGYRRSDHTIVVDGLRLQISRRQQKVFEQKYIEYDQNWSRG